MIGICVICGEGSGESSFCKTHDTFALLWSAVHVGKITEWPDGARDTMTHVELQRNRTMAEYAWLRLTQCCGVSWWEDIAEILFAYWCDCEDARRSPDMRSDDFGGWDGDGRAA